MMRKSWNGCEEREEGRGWRHGQKDAKRAETETDTGRERGL